MTGCAILPEFHVTDSSEALLSGRKPPFRLLAWVVDKENRNLTIRPAVSEGAPQSSDDVDMRGALIN